LSSSCYLPLKRSWLEEWGVRPHVLHALVVTPLTAGPRDDEGVFFPQDRAPMLTNRPFLLCQVAQKYFPLSGRDRFPPLQPISLTLEAVWGASIVDIGRMPSAVVC
ncbi:unnamed protein product, partial [Ectocarpus sp. 12 AP-2014]